ncbi:MAG TPA: carboxymuconolactone decarboxylase family protein [Burkholderiales bacterium]|nr:carboxymuconolactone decarboxylase family protein [Burkholderiales bacterium]
MIKLLSIAAGCLFALPPAPAHAQAPRFKSLPESEMTEAQLKAARELAGGPRGKLNPYGPNAVLLRSPELMDRTQRVGEYLRFKSSIPARLNEFAILITARQWSSQTEWIGHHDLALKAGLSPAVAADLAQGRRPASMKDDEAAVYQFCKELHDNKEVSDAAYKAALDRFGERGVVDLVGVTGYYTMLAMVLSVSRQPLPEGTPPPLPALK